MRGTKMRGQKTVSELISVLERLPEDAEIKSQAWDDSPVDIGYYRGYHEDVSIITGNTSSTIKQFLTMLREVIGVELGGYVMSQDTPVWIVLESGMLGEAVTGISIEPDGSFRIESREE